MRKELCATALLLALAGCGSISEPDRDTSAPIQTDRLSYSLENDGPGFLTTPVIRLVITNTSDAPAYLTRGDQRLALVLEGRENGEWITKWGRAIPDQAGGALRLEPGESATFETTIFGALPGTCNCSPIVDLEDGVYRFRLSEGYVDSYDEESGIGGEELPLEFRISNAFALDAP